MNSSTGIRYTDVFDTAQAPLGSCIEREDPVYGRQVWRYIKNSQGGALAAGEVVQTKDSTIWEVVKSATAITTPRLVGVAQFAIADAHYAFVLIEGFGVVMADTAGITANTVVMTGAATAGRAQDFAAGAAAENRTFAFATATAAAGVTARARISIQ